MAAVLVSSGQAPSRPRTVPIRPSEPRATLVNRLSRPTRLNCWAMKPMRMRALRTWSLTLPLAWTGPPKAVITPSPSFAEGGASTVCRPSIERSSVDLPEPDGPMSAIISPRLTSSETASSALRDPKVLEAARIERTGSDVMVGANP